MALQLPGRVSPVVANQSRSTVPPSGPTVPEGTGPGSSTPPAGGSVSRAAVLHGWSTSSHAQLSVLHQRPSPQPAPPSQHAFTPGGVYTQAKPPSGSFCRVSGTSGPPQRARAIAAERPAAKPIAIIRP